MPGQRGDEFLREVSARYPQIGRVLLTGQADAATVERARADGAAHRVVFKPWRPEQLRAAIAEATAAAS